MQTLPRMLYDARAFWAELRALPAGQRFQHLRAAYGASTGWLRELLLFAALGCLTVALAMLVTSGPAWLFLLLSAALGVTQSYTAVRWLDAAELKLRAVTGWATAQNSHNATTMPIHSTATAVPFAAPQHQPVVTVVEDVEPTVLVTPAAQTDWERVAPPPTAAVTGEAQATVVQIRSRVIGAEQPRRQATLKQVLGAAIPVRSS